MAAQILVVARFLKMEPCFENGRSGVGSLRVRADLGGAKKRIFATPFAMNILMRSRLTSVFEVLMRRLRPRPRGGGTGKVISKWDGSSGRGVRTGGCPPPPEVAPRGSFHPFSCSRGGLWEKGC